MRLRNAYLVTCTEAIKNAAGEIVELRGTYDPATRGGDAPDGRKVKATLHWVSAAHAVDAEVRLYDRLFTSEDPEGAAAKTGTDFTSLINPHSLEVLRGCKLEPSLGARRRQARAINSSGKDTSPSIRTRSAGAPVFNRTVSLKDSWAKRKSVRTSNRPLVSPPRRRTDRLRQRTAR